MHPGRLVRVHGILSGKVDFYDAAASSTVSFTAEDAAFFGISDERLFPAVCVFAGGSEERKISIYSELFQHRVYEAKGAATK